MSLVDQVMLRSRLLRSERTPLYRSHRLNHRYRRRRNEKQMGHQKDPRPAPNLPKVRPKWKQKPWMFLPKLPRRRGRVVPRRAVQKSCKKVLESFQRWNSNLWNFMSHFEGNWNIWISRSPDVVEDVFLLLFPAEHPPFGESMGYIPSGKHTKNYGKSPCLMGKLTLNGAQMGYFFYSYVSLPEATRMTFFGSTPQLLKDCTPIQALAVPHALTGKRDVMLRAPTGSGKTLAFLLPVVHQLLTIPGGVDRRTVMVCVVFFSGHGLASFDPFPSNFKIGLIRIGSDTLAICTCFWTFTWMFLFLHVV